VNTPVMRRILRWAVLSAAVLLAGCGGGKTDAVRAQAAQPVKARTVVLQASSVDSYIESPGHVSASHSAQIASRLTGYINQVNVDIGDRVKQGEVLLTIDSRDVDAKVRQARADIASARATLDDASANYKRYQQLYHQSAVSRQEYQRRKRDYKTAQAQLKASQARLNVALAERAYAQVRAPMAGVVTARDVDPGDLAAPGKPLLSLQGAGDTQVRTNVVARAHQALAPNKSVPIIAGSRRFSTRVIHVGPAASPSTQTYPVKLALPANAGLSPGTLVRVLVPVGKRQALLAPRNAIVDRLGIRAVFIVGGDGRAHLRLVRLGPRHGDRVEITAGLSAGTRVIVSPGPGIVNGTPIAGLKASR